MKKIAGVLALLFLWSVAPAFAAQKTVDTDTLKGWCQQQEVGVSAIGHLCEGYINGVADVLSGGNAINGNRACIPDKVLLEDYLATVIKALKDNTQNSQKAYDLVARVLAKAYPCK